MPTSGVTTWSLTARDIITAALHENAIIGIGRAPRAAEAEACLLRLNALLNSWPAGEHHETTGTVTIPADDPSGLLAQGIKEILGARVVLSATHQRPLARWTRDQYLTLPNKASSGDPTIYYDARQIGGVTLYVWPVPTVERTLAIDYIRRPETVTDLSQTVDWPQEYQEALYANLAVRCAGIFGVAVNPELAVRAARLEREVYDADRPDSYFLEPWGQCA